MEDARNYFMQSEKTEKAQKTRILKFYEFLKFFNVQFNPS